MQHCRICGSKPRFLFSTRDYARPNDQTEFRLFWCDACEFGRIEGEFTPERVSEFYPSDYYTHSAAARPSAKQSLFEKVRTHLAWRADTGVQFSPSEVPQGRTVCDLGCGNGNDLRNFKKLSYQAVGIDPDPLARESAKDVGNIFNGTAESLPAEIRGKTFDVVLMSHVLEHCVDPAKALANAKQLLTPSGTLVVEVPNNSAIGFSMFKENWPWSDIPRHLNFFTASSLQLLLEQSGMLLKDIRYVGYLRQFMPSWIHQQQQIWKATHNSPAPSFSLAAWRLLVRSALSSDDRKFDSVRMHAILS